MYKIGFILPQFFYPVSQKITCGLGYDKFLLNGVRTRRKHTRNKLK